MSIYTPLFVSPIFRVTMERVHAVKVFPRRRRKQDGTCDDARGPKEERKIILTLAAVEARVNLSMPEAALSLGIGVTTLKQACRRLGMPRWPYSRGASSSSSSSQRSKTRAPPTVETPLWFPDSMYPLWDPELWDPCAGTHPLCTGTPPSPASEACQDTADGCDLWFLACACSPRCVPLCQ